MYARADDRLPRISMNKLYIANYPPDTSEEGLRKLFVNKKLKFNNIVMKNGGFAFVECPDQSAADLAIDVLNGYDFNGSLLVVEPSITSFKKRGNFGCFTEKAWKFEDNK